MNISQQEAKRIMDSGEDCIILDVRGAEEYEQGHIPGATLLPLSELPARAEEELPDYEQQILVYCRSGTRSASCSRPSGKLGAYFSAKASIAALFSSSCSKIRTVPNAITLR